MGGLFIFWTYSDDSKQKKLFNEYYKVFPIEVPKTSQFAGEKIPLEDYEVVERFDRELLLNTYWQSNTLLIMKRSKRWFPILEKILKKNNIPDDFKYLCAVESGLINTVSPAGATGFWQILETTGKELGLEINDEVDERYDPIRSTEAAVRYLSTAYKLFGNWTEVAASYNIGMNGLRRAIQTQKANSFYDLMLNSETSRYLFRIFALKEILENPLKYGFIVEDKDLYPPIKTKIVTVDTTINDLAEFGKKFYISYKYLKLNNPWLRKNKLSAKPNKKYKILIPGSQPQFSPYYDEWLDSLMTITIDTSKTLPVGDSLPKISE